MPTKLRRVVGIVLLGFTLTSTFATQAEAQEFWNHFLRPDIGGALYFYNLSDSSNTEEYNFVHLGFLVGLNLPIVPLAENLSVGLNPSLGLSAQLTGYDASGVLSLEVPVYATLKYNTDASWKGSKAPVGFSAGLGVQSSNLLFTYSGITASYLVPSYLLEINFGSRRGNKGLYKLRWTSYIGSYDEPLEEFGDETITFKQFALNLLWVPGY
ncbi:MAG: hypothetical protein KDD67_11730 [Ignavibacteriae bacterium]|nr:hypothetical protein [Ignavibacteriota bacterium]MCB9214957.1 hypothetical protein [Ignavibacteria bacterium]